MSSHPDADAFMRGYLRQPNDVTARLVFADWLEETGIPWNRAWAYYIRVSAEADSHPPGSRERRHYERQAAEYSPRIRARLTIPADLFVGYPKSLLQLLPGPNIEVQLDEFTPHDDSLQLVPASVTWERLVFPLAHQRSDRQAVLILAAETPNVPELRELMELIHNRRVILVGGTATDITAAIERHYSDVFDWLSRYPAGQLRC